MSLSPSTSHGGGLAKLYDSTLAAPAASIDTGANGIAITYDVLMVWIIAQSAEAAVFSTLVIQVNNDATAIYDYTLLRNRNTTVAGATSNAQTSWPTACHGAQANASYPAITRITIPGYRQTTFFKVGEMTYGQGDSAAAAVDVGTFMLGYRSTAAISRMAISVSGGSNLATGSRLLICGV